MASAKTSTIDKDARNGLTNIFKKIQRKRRNGAEAQVIIFLIKMDIGDAL
jgi:hypothetical protein